MNLVLWLSAIIFIADQIAKYFSIKYLPLNRCIPVIKDFFNLTLVFNTGAAFGMLVNRNLFLIIISLVTIISLIVFAVLYSSENRLLRVSIGMILGGAAGNLFDRIFRGYVVDFADFYLGTYHWPAFNVADSSICIGTFLLAIFLLRSK